MAEDPLDAAVQQHGGWVLDVPVTLTVAVRGPDLSYMQACAIAREFADGLSPSHEYLLGYNKDQPNVVTEATLESPTDEAVSDMEQLHPEPEEDDPEFKAAVLAERTEAGL